MSDIEYSVMTSDILKSFDCISDSISQDVLSQIFDVIQSDVSLQSQVH